MGSFLFSGEEVEKPISLLSGGEKARVALAKLSMDQDNFLILDEPTNHLDIDNKEDDYGTVKVIDRNKISNGSDEEEISTPRRRRV